MNSFRLKLAVLAGAIAAVLLIGTGAFAWRVTLRFNLDRLDRELRNIGAANLERVVGDSHWQRVDSALGFVSRPERPPTYALWAENYGRQIYRSPHWPAGIAPEKLAAPATYENGQSFAPPPPPPRQRDPISATNPALPRKEPYFVTMRAGGSEWRLGVMGSPYTTLVVAANVDGFNAELTQLRRTFLAALPIALLMVGGGAWFFAGRALRPVHALTEAAERVTARGLDQRIAADSNDREFQRLVTVFNAMMDRLEKSFHQATRFSADASHELKTPLALLQMELEHALASANGEPSQQQVYLSLLEEVQRLKAIVQKLLLLSLADSGRLEVHRVPVDLSELLRNVIEDTTALGSNLAVEQAIAPEIMVEADRVLLEQAFQNVAGNALKYNRQDGRVHFELKVENGHAVVSIGNTGPGIRPEDRAHVFERFFRGDRARGRHGPGGVGLGLSLSREIIRAHGGELSLSPPREDWTEFVATLAVLAPKGERTPAALTASSLDTEK